MTQKKLMTGDVVLFRKNGSWISNAISAFTNGSYTHVGIISSVNKAEVKLAEALQKGVTLSHYPLETFYAKIDNGSYEVIRSKVNLMNIKSIILKHLGTPYGFGDLLLIFISKFTGKILFKGSANKLICSEAVSRILYDASHKELNLSKEFDKPYSYITPDDIFMSNQFKRI